VTGWIFLSISFINIQGIVISSIITFVYLSVANYRAVKRYSRIKIDWVHDMIKPLIASLIMGVITYFVYLGMKSLFGILWGLLIAVALAVIFYFVIMILIKGITEEELGYFPGSGRLLKIYGRVNGLTGKRKED
jgi:stage V sporulation protein B